jgi:integration host factor subunit alpha
LTRDDLAEAVRKEVGFSKVESRQLVDFVLESVVQALERGEDVKLTNFGVFEIRQKGERIGRNPRTGETATITPRQTITFSASSNMKAKVERG